MVRASSFVKAVGLGALLLNAPSMALGQPMSITGRVVDGVSLQPIVAATVEIRGDITTVARTDSAGRYSIAIPRPDVTLVFKALGFAEQEVAPEGRRVVNVPLTPRPLRLKELVVTGYGRQDRATVSGRVDSSSASIAPGTLPCDGAALPGSPAFDPRTPPLRLPPPDVPRVPIPNACTVPTPGGGAE